MHKDFVIFFRYALVWVTWVKHPGQKFDLKDHVLEDGDVVSIYLRRSY